MHIVVTGGSGLVGGKLCKTLQEQGHKVTLAPRIQDEVPPVFSECDAIVHLAGANIFHRWTPKYKQLILDSRVKTAEAIFEYLSKQARLPAVFISASATGIYGDRGDETLDETSAPGTGFLAEVCVEWEKAREKFSILGMRTVSIRTGTVLSREGGFLSKMLPIFRWGLGGKFGQGTQWFPWIHMDDLVNFYIQAILDPKISGAINAVAPEMIRNVDFVNALGIVLKKPTFLTVPRFALQIFLGDLSSVILSSQRVLSHPRFTNHYPTLESALKQLLNP